MAITRSGIDYDELIQEDRVHGRLYCDPDIFQEEMEKIWHRGWVYVGHESEIKEPGDYVLRNIGLQSVIMCRDQDGRVHLLMNRCRHRANTVCQAEKGNSMFFRCAYHGWSYSNKGDLVGVTYEDGYDEGFRKEEYGLINVPRVGIHRGFIFGSLSPTGEDFYDYLGDAKNYIDRVCDLAPDGEVLLTAGRQKIHYRGNWKYQLENLVDGYHVPFVHMMSRVYESRARVDRQVPQEYGSTGDYGHGHTTLGILAQRRNDYSAVAGGRVDQRGPTGAAGTTDPRVMKGIAKRVGSMEEAERIVNAGPPHMMVFPNLMLIWEAIRVLQPVSANETQIHFYPVMLKGAPEDINIMRLRSHEFGQGPGGRTGPDDWEMFERNQLGMEQRVNEWLLLRRGFNDDKVLEDDFGVPVRTGRVRGSELPQRAIWQHYKSVMSAL